MIISDKFECSQYLPSLNIWRQIFFCWREFIDNNSFNTKCVDTMTKIHFITKNVKLI